MGKSIVHCAQCGNAIREDDFARGHASTQDDRAYCSACRPVTSSIPRAAESPRSSTSRIPRVHAPTPPRGEAPRGSTTRIMRAQTTTRRMAVVAPASGNSRAAIAVVGSLVGVVVVVLVAFALSGKGSSGDGQGTAPEPETKIAKTPPAARRESAPLPAKPPAPAPGAEKTAEKPPREAAGDFDVKPRTTIRIRLTSPVEGASFRAPADIPMEAEADGAVARVEFWQGGAKLGEATEAPYRFTWKGAPPGRYEVMAKLVEPSGSPVESLRARIAVEPGDPVAAKPEEPAPKPPAEEPAKPEPAKPPGAAPEKKDPVLLVDQKKVDAAIKKGTAYLIGQVGKLPAAFAKEPERESRTDELVLWTLLHTGMSEESPVFRFLFKTVTESELRRTYEVALQAMILEEFDRGRYQTRLQQCAQFLVDNQCVNGQWSYGMPTKETPPTPGGLPVATPTKTRSPSGAMERVKPVVTRKLKVTATRTGPPEGDNSNAQYAALGLRACADAGIVIPEEALRRAQNWFRGTQYAPAAGAPADVPTGTAVSAPPAGWCYGPSGHGHGAYGSMTAGAVGALAIYDTLLGEEWRKDRSVGSGLAWLGKNFSAVGNPGPPSEEWAKGDPHWCHYYYLYALERAGVLCKTETMGTHVWYLEGANFLLAAQEKQGSWNSSPLDTCFAILFLKRATRPLKDVASTDERPRK